MSRRAAFETLRAGPALVSSLPAEVVDIDRLVAHLVARGFGGGVHVAGGAADGLLWIYEGGPQEAWSFEAGGTEAVLLGEPGRDLIRQIAAQGARVSVFVGAPPPVPAPTAWENPAPAPREPAPLEPASSTPAPDMPAPSRTEPPRAVKSHASGPGVGTSDEPSPHPWPAILEDVAERVARHRGQRLASRFTTALEAALAPYGGRVANGRISAPPLDRSTWRVVVETACAPVVAIAGRAFVDRTIAAAERHITAGRGKGGSAP